MASSRFVGMLQTLFSDPLVADQHRESCKKYIAKGWISRVFDDFPNFIKDDELKYFLEKLNRTRAHIKRRLVNNTLSYFMVRSINVLVVDMIQYACSELCDESGNIKREIIELLHWQDMLQEVEVYRLITAYLSGVIASLFTMDCDLGSEYKDNDGLIFTYINQNSLSLIKRTYNQKFGHDISGDLMLLGAGLLTLFGSALLAGVAYSYSTKNNHEDHEDHEDLDDHKEHEMKEFKK